MEKSKVKRICFSVLKVVLLLAAMVGAFAISVWAGLSAVVFFAAGFLWGYFLRSLRITQKFMQTFLDEKENLLSGKIVTIVSDETTGEVSLQLKDEKTPKKTTKKKEETSED